MKKRFHIPASHGLLLLALVAVATFCSSFVISAKSADVSSVSQEVWSALHNYSFHKLNFWQKTALSLGAFGASAFALRRFRRRHDVDLGCLGVLGALVLGLLIIVLLPVLLIIGLFMLIFGIPIRWGRHQWRRDHRSHRHRR
jgi:Na+/H+-dicarboxylate symporter